MKKKHNLSRNEEKPPVTKSKYELATIIISIISILTSTAVGILAIINSNAIAKIDNVPNLEYFFGQDQAGPILLHINNSGKISAENVIINISYGSDFILNKCKVLPPFQDIQQVQPVEEHYITYRISNIPVGSILIISCSLHHPYIVNAIDKETNKIKTVIFDTSDIKGWKLYSTLLAYDIINAQIFSTNSKPALESSKRPIVSVDYAIELTEDAYKKATRENSLLIPNTITIPISNLTPISITAPLPTTPTP